jgi:N-acetylglucosamine-6-phosphate deacetylase
MFYLHHLTLLTPQQHIEHGAALIEGRRLAAVGRVEQVPQPSQARVIDAHGLILAPGFIDLQINGGFGFDFTADPTSLWQVAARLPRYGVTAFLPTLITSPPETAAQALKVLAEGPPENFHGARPLGWHFEGPFLNPDKKGAHNPAHLRTPSLDTIAAWSPDNGVRLVTLAPELPGALEVIRALQARGVVLSAGHSTATFAQAHAGFSAGITYGTHLFNAMPPLHHREPGLPGALLSNPHATAGMIPDGVHVQPAMVELAWHMKGPHGLTLVSDAMAALGMPPGEYVLGDLRVLVDETSARLRDGTLAGSIMAPDAALRNLISFTGAPLAEALHTLTHTPARLLGLADRGQLSPGQRADLVLLTPDLQVAATWVAGKQVYQNPEHPIALRKFTY